MLLGITVQIICQSSKKTPEEEGPLIQELLQWLAANTAAEGREVTDTQGRCSTELLHLDGAFWFYCSFPAMQEASANDASSLG